MKTTNRTSDKSNVTESVEQAAIPSGNYDRMEFCLSIVNNPEKVPAEHFFFGVAVILRLGRNFHGNLGRILHERYSSETDVDVKRRLEFMWDIVSRIALIKDYSFRETFQRCIPAASGFN